MWLNLVLWLLFLIGLQLQPAKLWHMRIQLIALGAFLAGVVLSDSEYPHALEGNIAPFKGLLLGLFFMTIGSGVDASVVFANTRCNYRPDSCCYYH